MRRAFSSSERTLKSLKTIRHCVAKVYRIEPSLHTCSYRWESPQSPVLCQYFRVDRIGKARNDRDAKILGLPSDSHLRFYRKRAINHVVGQQLTGGEFLEMTYARARLWLGICGVGSLVAICTAALIFQLPHLYLSNSPEFSWTDLSQLAATTLVVTVWLAPFDFLGGYQLPKKFHKSFNSFGFWCRSYLRAAIGQSSLFLFFAVGILIAGRAYGLIGSLVVIGLGTLLCLALRNQLMRARQLDSKWAADKFVDVLEIVQSWNIFVPKTMIVKHRDIGFTGGIIGVGNSARIVVPEAWLKVMSKQQLATAIARRAVAINSGSYARGLKLAFAWNVIGFVGCTLLPNAGLNSVAELVTTICGFTLWSFLGLLTLPTVSRNASLRIDEILSQHGTPSSLIWDTAYSLDQLQDGEPSRPKLIETIFHPVPSVASRNRQQPPATLEAWNVARTTLFFSWACFGILSRAVHCNVGRPELWTMLPTD